MNETDDELIIAAKGYEVQGPFTIILLVYRFLVIFIGIIGNCIFLVGSMKNNALKMDKLSAILLEVIAIADVFILVTSSLPSFVSLFSRSWAFGKVLCYIVAFYTRVIPYVFQLYTVLTVSIYRSLTIKYTKQRRYALKTKPMILILGAEFALACVPSLRFTFSDSFAFFQPRALLCTGTYYYDERYLLQSLILMVAFSTLPLILIIAVNIYIIAVVKINSATSKTRSLITIGIVCWVYILSYTPFYLDVILSQAGAFKVSPVWFDFLSNCALELNSIANPIIYFFTNRRFKSYCLSYVRIFRGQKIGVTQSYSQSTAVANKGTHEDI